MVLDTQMWIWLSTGSRPLPPQVLAALRGGGFQPRLSATSLWELAMLIEKGRLGTIQGVRETVDVRQRHYLLIDSEIDLLSRTLPFEHEDPADRFIAATAHSLGVPLATSDARLLSLPWFKTIS